MKKILMALVLLSSVTVFADPKSDFLSGENQNIEATTRAGIEKDIRAAHQDPTGMVVEGVSGACYYTGYCADDTYYASNGKVACKIEVQHANQPGIERATCVAVPQKP